MCQSISILAAAVAISGCTADPAASLTTMARIPTGERDGTNGGPEFFTDELVNVMQGNGYKNSTHHQRYENKARALVGVGTGPINDPIAQELVGAMVGVLTNTTGAVVHVRLRSVEFGDFPGNEWKREDRAHVFEWRGDSDIAAHYCIGDDAARGVRDQRRIDTYLNRDIGAFTNAGACQEISGFQQLDQAYGDVKTESRVFATTAILATLADPSDADAYMCLETGDCSPIDCDGAVALYQGEMLCMGCGPEDVVYGAEGYPTCMSAEEEAALAETAQEEAAQEEAAAAESETTKEGTETTKDGTTLTDSRDLKTSLEGAVVKDTTTQLEPISLTGTTFDRFRR